MNEQKLDRLEVLIETYQEGLFRFAFFRTGSSDDSADIVQGVFLRLYDRAGDLAAIANIKSYLYRSVANACADSHRRRQSKRTVPLDKAAHIHSDENPDYDATKEYERIDAILGTSPQEQAEVIKMRTVDSLAFTEIADILGIAVTTVKSRFKYGIDKLKTSYEKQRF